MLTDRPLPQATDIERTVLGSMLADKQTAEKVFELLAPDCFYFAAHKQIFLAAKELNATEKPVDIISINEALENKGELERAGGSSYLAELGENLTVFSNIEYYCHILLERAARRTLIQNMSSIINMAFDMEILLENLSVLTNEVAQKISDATEAQNGNEQDKAQIIIPYTLTERMKKYNSERIVPQGEDTGWVSLNKHYKPARGTLNIIVGAPAHGKSEVLDALAINLSLLSQWRWLIFSPENYPTELHLKKLIEKHIGKNIHNCSETEIENSMIWINQFFIFVKLSEDNHNFDALMRLIRQTIKDQTIDGIIIDPWNELDVQTGEQEKETDRIGRQLSRLRRFGRRNDIAIFIAAHPAKMYRNRNTGKYDIPTLYDISGSAHFSNRADNGFCVYREIDETTGALKDEIQLHIQKVKFKIHGSQGLVNLFYDRESGRFTEERTATQW